jgi:hypothetical protein
MIDVHAEIKRQSAVEEEASRKTVEEAIAEARELDKPVRLGAPAPTPAVTTGPELPTNGDAAGTDAVDEPARTQG